MSFTGNPLADVTLIGAVLAAATSIVVALLTVHQNHKLQEIHVLVNSRLTLALAKIEALERELQKLTP